MEDTFCRSADTQLKLVSEKQFYEEAPTNISQPIVTRNNAHKRHIARLNYELQQRAR